MVHATLPLYAALSVFPYNLPPCLLGVALLLSASFLLPLLRNRRYRRFKRAIYI